MSSEIRKSWCMLNVSIIVWFDVNTILELNKLIYRICLFISISDVKDKINEIVLVAVLWTLTCDITISCAVNRFIYYK